MSEIKKPQRVDVSSYIEVIQVFPETFQKAIRTGEGNVNNSVADLAYRGKILSQDEQALEEATLIPKIPTINYKINNNVIPDIKSFSLGFIENVYIDEILPQGFGEQPVLDNCGIGTNIYYDGEVATEYTELGWNTYAIDWGGNYVAPEQIAGLIQPVIYDDLKFGLISTYARAPGNSLQTVHAKISQSYSNIPAGSLGALPPVDYILNQRISDYINDKDIKITAGNNAYFSFDVFNDTSYTATLIVQLGSNTTRVEILPNARNRIATSVVTDDVIDVAVTAQTIIEPQITTLLFGTLVTAANNVTSLEQLRLNTDIVLIDTRTKRYFPITIFDNAPLSVTSNFRNALYLDSRAIASTIYKQDTSELWWIYKGETIGNNNIIQAEVFDYESNGAKWKRSEGIYSVDQRFEIFDAKLIGDEIYVLINRIYDSNEVLLYNQPDVEAGLLRECAFIIYNTKTENAKYENLTTSLGIGGLRRFTRANDNGEFFAINDDSVYRLAVNNSGQWSIKYKTTTRDNTSTVPTNVSKMQIPDQLTTSALEPYNSVRFRDILYDKQTRKLYLSLQANGSISRPQESGATASSFSSNSIFVAKCEADQTLTAEQVIYGNYTPTTTCVADLLKIGNKIYFSNSETNGVGYPINSSVFGPTYITEYERQYFGLGPPRILPSGYFGTQVKTAEIVENGKFISYTWDPTPHDPFQLPFINFQQSPPGVYSYQDVISIRRDLARPEIGLSAITLGPTREASYSQEERRIYISNFSLCYEAIGGIEDSNCIGEDIGFNGQFKSGLAGWTVSGYVGLNGPAIELSSNCQGFNQDPIISQVHYSGGPITPVDTLILAEDKIKLIADIENISINDSEVYATVNGKTKGYLLKPGERRFATVSNLVGNDNLATSSIRVKTTPVAPPQSTISFIAPVVNDWEVDGDNVIGNNWYSYNLFSKEIKVRPLGNADRAYTTGRYTAIGKYVYTVNSRNDSARGLIRRTNAAEDSILYNYLYFIGDNRHSFESLSPAGDNLCVIRRFATEKYLDIIDTVSGTILNTYDLTPIQSQYNGAGTLLPCFDGKRNVILLGINYQIFKLDLETKRLELITSLLPNISSITIDPQTGLYYVASVALTTDLSIDDEYKIFNSGPNIYGIDQFGGIIRRTSIYRGDRPVNNVSVPVMPGDLVQYSPLLSLTCITVNNRKFLMWAKNEPIVRNSTGFKEQPSAFNDYGYTDTVGYNNTSLIYVHEINGDLQDVITNARVAACLHNKHINRTSPLTFWNEQ